MYYSCSWWWEKTLPSVLLLLLVVVPGLGREVYPGWWYLPVYTSLLHPPGYTSVTLHLATVASCHALREA